MKTIMLVVHFLGLAMGIGTGIGHIFLGTATKKMDRSEALKFIMNSFALSKMGTIGIILLVLSGSYLIIPYWSNILEFPFLVIKLCLVAILIVILLIIGSLSRKANHSPSPEPYLKVIKSISPFSLLTAILIVIMAVLTFH